MQGEIIEEKKESVIPSNVFEWIKGWAAEKSPKIKKVYKFNGGWEKWAQIDMALYMNDLLNTRSISLREVNAYTNERSKADLFLRPFDDLDPGLLVELKCYNQYLDLASASRDFVNGVMKDVEKRTTIKDAWKELWYMAVGVGVGKDVLKEVSREVEKTLAALNLDRRAMDYVDDILDNDVWVVAVIFPPA